jgi:2,3,4,5-tetrahydropyridine-2-carboxylate N-succinyltransferase
MSELEVLINEAYENKGLLKEAKYSNAVAETIKKLDDGEVKTVTVNEESVYVNEWVKKAILLYFLIAEIKDISTGPFTYKDKIPLKNLTKCQVRAVPGAIVRYGAYVDDGAILMPSFVNIGAYVGQDSMVDTWATVGSCAYVGHRVHLAGGVGIGGVLEPPNAVPVVIHDDVLIGSRAMITEGARVGKGAVIGAGAILNPSIPVMDAQSGKEISRGYVPPYCVAVFATRKREFGSHSFYLPCLVVIKRLEPGQRHDKALLNDILRSEGVVS